MVPCGLKCGKTDQLVSLFYCILQERVKYLSLPNNNAASWRVKEKNIDTTLLLRENA